MAKAINFETLPREIRAALYRIDDPQTFTVERFNPQAITVINTRISRVYKAVRRNKRLIAAFDREIDNLILLRNKKLRAPMPLNRQPLKQYEMVAYAYVDGEIMTGKLSPENARLLAAAQRKLHQSFEREGQTKSASINAAKALKPIFAKANAAEFEPEMISFARSIARALKSHENARENIEQFGVEHLLRFHSVEVTGCEHRFELFLLD